MINRSMHRLIFLLLIAVQENAVLMGSPPIVTMSSTSFEWFIGQSVILQCSVFSPNANVLSVEWIFMNDKGTNFLNAATDSKKYRGMTQGYPSLIIYNLSNSDVGSYRCTGTNTFGTGRSKTALALSVKDSTEPTGPEVSVFQTSYTVLSGSNVLLQCEVSSNDSEILSVDWLFSKDKFSMNIGPKINSRYIGGSVIHPSLHITNTTKSDEGIYICTATNAHGSVNGSSIQLTITDIPFVTIDSTSYITTFGDSVKLGCTVFSNSPVLEVYWRRTTGVETQLIRYNTIGISGSSIDYPSLTIKVTTDSDSGSYACFASNRHGIGQSESTNLTVIGGIPIIKANRTYVSIMFGESVTLGVEVAAHPQFSNVYWERNVNGIRSQIHSNAIGIHGVSLDDPSLTIYFATTSDDAIYVCYAENSFGTGKSENIILAVGGELPEVQINSTRHAAFFGEKVTIPCIIQSIPLHFHVFWEKKRDDITTRITSTTAGISGATIQKPTLDILFSTMSDSGLYTCYAENVIGIGSSRATTLSIVGGKPHVEIDSSLYTVLFGTSITMTCRVTSVPPAIEVYWWKRISGDVYSTITSGTTGTTGASVEIPSLTLTLPSKSDSGEYFCFATNELGTGGSLPTILLVTGDMPVVTVPTLKMSVNFGDNITIRCEVNAVPSHTKVYWKHINNGNVRYIYFNTLGIAGVHPDFPSLVIHTVTTTDSGLYTCFSKNIVGTGASGQLQLTVRGDIPTVETTILTVTVNHGQTAVLLCIIDAYPMHTQVYWEVHKNNIISVLNHGTTGTIGITISNPSLTLSPAYISDTGLYTCVAMNAVGSGRSRQIYLKVSAKGNVTVQDNKGSESNDEFGVAEIVTIISGALTVIIGGILFVLKFAFRIFDAPVLLPVLDNVRAIVNRETVIEFDAIAPLELKNIQLHKKTGTILECVIDKRKSDTNDNLMRVKLRCTFHEIKESGQYICKASTRIRKGRSKEITVTVKVSWNEPTITILDVDNDSVLPGNPVDLKCCIDSYGDELTMLTWKLNKKVLQVSNRYSGGTIQTPSLHIKKLQKEDIGLYTCCIENANGVGIAEYDLKVSSYTVTIQETSVDIFTQKKIACEVVPTQELTSIVWFKDNKKIQKGNVRYQMIENDMPFLTIQDFKKEDEGFYKCTITNSFDQSVSSTSLQLTDNQPLSKKLSVKTDIVGMLQVYPRISVTITCSVKTTDELLNVKWELNGKELDLSNSNKYSNGTISTNSLTILNLEKSDIGWYRCTVSTRSGSMQSDYHLQASCFTLKIRETPHSNDRNKQLRCEVDHGNIIDSVEWIKDGVLIQGNDTKYEMVERGDPSLTIHNFDKRKDEGRYQCKLTNLLGAFATSNSIILKGADSWCNLL